MNISEIIKPIELKTGSHEDTNKTGSGCFMNVIAYLNGEDQITDNSPCVHPILRSFMIRVNDRFVGHGYGPRLIPFIQRAMNTSSMGGEWLSFRFADMAVREILPIQFRHAGLDDWAGRLESLSPVTIKTSRTCRELVFQAINATRDDISAGVARAAYASSSAYAYGIPAAADCAVSGSDETRDSRFGVIESTLDRVLPAPDIPSQRVISAATELVRLKESA